MDWRKADNCVRNGFHATVTFMKTIEIAIALIIRNENGKRALFAARRNYGEYKGFWEFPGGKLEAGEMRDACIVREMREELSLDVSVEKAFETVEYDYPAFHLIMHCMLCAVTGGTMTLSVHDEARFLSKEKLYSVRWLPADFAVLKKIERLL